MQDLETKKKVLEEIMGLMDEKEGDRLKSHPKLMAAKVEFGKPKDDIDEPLEVTEDPEKSEDEDMDPEMIKKLLEMMNGQ